jgi:pyrroloquinoline quinone biosynthesis protein B
VCSLAWAGDPRVKARTQASIAVSADGERWVLINASPDLRAQIAATPALHPRKGLRDSPIAAVILSGGEIDQIAGLLSLREREPFTIYGTADTLGAIAENPVFNVLAPDLVPRQSATPGEVLILPGGLEAELFIVPGKAPLYREGADPQTASETGANAGVEISADSARIAYVPGAAAVTPAVLKRLTRADVTLFDGTLYRDDEMIVSGAGTKSGRRMGHMPIEGKDGSLAALGAIPGRRIYIHINNTNPILVEGSAERAQVEARGWEIARDGMEIVL